MSFIPKCLLYVPHDEGCVLPGLNANYMLSAITFGLILVSQSELVCISQK